MRHLRAMHMNLDCGEGITFIFMFVVFTIYLKLSILLATCKWDFADNILHIKNPNKWPACLHAFSCPLFHPSISSLTVKTYFLILLNVACFYTDFISMNLYLIYQVTCSHMNKARLHDMDAGIGCDPIWVRRYRFISDNFGYLYMRIISDHIRLMYSISVSFLITSNTHIYNIHAI